MKLQEIVGDKFSKEEYRALAEWTDNLTLYRCLPLLERIEALETEIAELKT